jgi:NAD(P)-dependent dehydrogenase (short-subunit alcohol dehydrogenase family)
VSVSLCSVEIVNFLRLPNLFRGWTDTVLAQEFIESLNGLITADTVPQLFKRLAEPDDVAGMIVFLLSDDSKFATKGIFSVDGGYIA